MILDIQGVSFSYNSHPILEDIRFDVGEGKLLAVLGPNGVGKTTLLKCINAILRPRTGTVLVDGDAVNHMAPSEIALRVGYVSQRTETARLTVFDAVLMGRKPHIRWKPSPKDLNLVETTIREVGLETLAMRSIDRLSGGELQKVAIARALVQEPRLLLLDEPTSALDLRNQVAVLKLVRRVVDEGRMGAVMTMHDLNTALRYADLFVFVKDGRIVAHGSVEDVTDQLISDVYGLSVHVHRVDGAPIVVPVE